MSSAPSPSHSTASPSDRSHDTAGHSSSAQAFAFTQPPEAIRLAVQRLMKDGLLERAQALSDAGLVAHPANEDTVGVAALVALMRGDFAEARELLTLLVVVQGIQAPDATFWMLARACRCVGDDRAALDALETGLARFPGSQVLQAELEGFVALND